MIANTFRKINVINKPNKVATTFLKRYYYEQQEYTTTTTRSY